MNPTRISKKFKFEAGHILPGHNGKCANQHGHSYVVDVWIKGDVIGVGSSEGMVMDFADLKAIVQPLINAMDHKFLCSGLEPVMLETTEEQRERWGLVPFNVGVRTTAENLARFIWDYIEARLLKEKGAVTVLLMGVVVCETADTTAEYISVVGGQTVSIPV